jgi:hypothetical protein
VTTPPVKVFYRGFTPNRNATRLRSGHGAQSADGPRRLRQDAARSMVSATRFTCTTRRALCSKMIYPLVCEERVARRQRHGEGEIGLEYLRRCDEYHEEMVGCVQHHGLDGNRDICRDALDIVELNDNINFKKK